MLWIEDDLPNIFTYFANEQCIFSNKGRNKKKMLIINTNSHVTLEVPASANRIKKEVIGSLEITEAAVEQRELLQAELPVLCGGDNFENILIRSCCDGSDHFLWKFSLKPSSQIYLLMHSTTQHVLHTFFCLLIMSTFLLTIKNFDKIIGTDKTYRESLHIESLIILLRSIQKMS